MIRITLHGGGDIYTVRKLYKLLHNNHRIMESSIDNGIFYFNILNDDCATIKTVRNRLHKELGVFYEGLTTLNANINVSDDKLIDMLNY